ncbi:MAG: hypothetical protein IKA44_00265 [Clostridia bacterium]|nr:hypothetical protein [Clostridia bacterium]
MNEPWGREPILTREVLELAWKERTKKEFAAGFFAGLTTLGLLALILFGFFWL